MHRQPGKRGKNMKLLGNKICANVFLRELNLFFFNLDFLIDFSLKSHVNRKANLNIDRNSQTLASLLLLWPHDVSGFCFFVLLLLLFCFDQAMLQLCLMHQASQAAGAALVSNLKAVRFMFPPEESSAALIMIGPISSALEDKEAVKEQSCQ